MKVTCELCGDTIEQGLAVYLTPTNKPTEKPRCRECYERSIRFVGNGTYADYATQRSPVAVDVAYHGFGGPMD